MYIVKRRRAPWEGFLLGPAQPLGGPVQHDSSVTTEQDLFVYHYKVTTFLTTFFIWVFSHDSRDFLQALILLSLFPLQRGLATQAMNHPVQ